MQSINSFLREKARISYEKTIAEIPDLIRYHDIAKKAGEMFVTRGYGRSFSVERSTYAPTVILRLESTAILAREAQFLTEALDDTFNLHDYDVSQEVDASGLLIRYKKDYRSCFVLFFKLKNSKTCKIIVTKKQQSYDVYERIIIC